MLWTADTLMYSGVSYDAAYSGETLVWKKSEPEDNYLTFTILGSGRLAWQNASKPIEYKRNDDAWTSTGSGVRFSVNAGDVVRFRGTYDTFEDTSCFYNTRCMFNLSGNIMSLMYGDDFEGKTALTQSNCFKNMFAHQQCVDASALKLPALYLTSGCYEGMFYNNPRLTQAPVLPTPISMGTGCYKLMFSLSTSLTTAPDLLKQSVPDEAYYQMFKGCTSLNYVKCTSGGNGINATYEWLSDVAAEGTFVKNAAIQWSTGPSGIPSGWTVVDA